MAYQSKNKLYWLRILLSARKIQFQQSTEWQNHVLLMFLLSSVICSVFALASQFYGLSLTVLIVVVSVMGCAYGMLPEAKKIRRGSVLAMDTPQGEQYAQDLRNEYDGEMEADLLGFLLESDSKKDG